MVVTPSLITSLALLLACLVAASDALPEAALEEVLPEAHELEDDDGGCGAAGASCAAELSLRQLRGELHRGKVHTDSVADGEGETDEATENETHDGGNGASDEETEEDEFAEGEQISCQTNRLYCGDIMTYRTRNHCLSDGMCRVIDGEDVNNISGKAWLCAPNRTECDEHIDLDFQSVDEYPIEYAAQFEAELESEEDLEDGLGDGLQADAVLQPAVNTGYYYVHRRRVGGTCWLRSCYTYMRHMPCQCNSGCVQYANCCPDYNNFCGGPLSGGGETTTTTMYWPVYSTVPPYQPVYTSATTTTRLPVGGFHGTSMVAGEIKTLYHTTSREIADLIVETGFRPGSGGWCGGAIYFIDHPHLKKSKFNPKTTKTGAIVQAQVRMGYMARMDRKCNGHFGHGTSAAKRSGYNSLTFNPGDGDEYIIWDTQQVMSVKIYEYTKSSDWPSEAPRRRRTYVYHIHRRRGIPR